MNTFSLDLLNRAMFVAIHDERATEIADQGFRVLSETTQRHLRLDGFVEVSKGDLLGAIMDDMSNKILNPDRYNLTKSDGVNI